MARNKRRSRRNRGESGTNYLAISFAIILGGASLFGIFFLSFKSFTAEKVDYDLATMCIKNRPYTDVVSVLIDSTDTIPQRAARQAEIYIQKVVDDAPENSLVLLYRIDDSGSEHLKPIARLCKPATGADASQLKSNPELIKKRFNEGFFVPFSEQLSRLLTKEPGNSTPLIESIQSSLIESFQANENTGKNVLIIVSDFLQHSDLYSFYRQTPDYHAFDSFRKQTGLGLTNLKGVKVDLLVIPRNVPRGDRRDVVRFWASFLEENHADMNSKMEPLS